MSYSPGDGVWLRAHVIREEGDPRNPVVTLQLHGFIIPLSALSINRDRALLDEQTIKPSDLIRIDMRSDDEHAIGIIQMDRSVRILTEEEANEMREKQA